MIPKGYRDNVMLTYCEIAKSFPDAVLSILSDVVICRGSFRHPIVNFTFLLEPSGKELALEPAGAIDHLNLYTFDQDPGGLDGRVRLGRAMPIMSHPGPTHHSKLTMARSDEERKWITRFMADQFFPTQKRQAREGIAGATANASKLMLYGFTPPGRDHLVGAGMLHVTDEVVGLYNVCVEASCRGRGWGKTIVEALLAESAQWGRPVTLQCDSHLTGWYEQFGFKTVGSLQIWSFFQDELL